MIELRGNSYHTKRTEINKFIKINNNIQIELYDSKLHKNDVNILFQKRVSDKMRYMPKENAELFLMVLH